jgi:hypothetical protein
VAVGDQQPPGGLGFFVNFQRSAMKATGLIYFTQMYTVIELTAKLRPCIKYTIPNLSYLWRTRGV